MSTIACRICLSIESRKVTILHTPLQAIYERITNIPLDTGDGRPVMVCYVCCYQLEKCGNLIQKSMEADTLFKRILSHGVEITESAICALPKRQVFPNLSITHNKVLSVGLPLEHEVTIKVEVKPDDEAVTEESIQNLSSNGPGLLVEHSSLGYQVENDGLITAIKQEEKVDDTDPEVGSEDAQEEVWCNPVSTKPNLNSTFLEITLSPSEIPQTHKTDTVEKRHGNICDICGLSFNTKMGLTRHQNVKQHLTAGGHKCQYCGNIYTEKYILSCHIRLEHTKKDLHDCHYCSKKFSLKKSLRTHLKSHTRQKLRNCRYCKEVFDRHDLFEKHLKQHTFDCDYCGKSYKQKYALIYHMRTHTSRDIMYYRCNICPKKYTMKPRLNYHMRIHSGVKSFACKYCEMTFYYNASLKRHTLTHTGIKPYECDYCGKSYKDRRAIIDHINLKHNLTGKKLKQRKIIIKKFQCTICPKIYATTTELRIHTKSHSGERPHQCVYCKKGFVLKKQLNVHLQIHSEIRHKCKYCEKSYNQEQNLRKHEKTHLSGKPVYVCVHCNKGLACPSSLKKHLKRHVEDAQRIKE